MNHKERLRLAREISDRMAKRSGRNIISIGIFGSVARNGDDEHSDLELIVITRNRGFFRQHKTKGIVVQIVGIPVEKALKKIRTVDEEWPVRPGYLIHQKIIHGDKSVLGRFRREFNQVKNSDLKRAANKMIVWMLDSLNKVKNASQAGNRGKALVPLAFYTIQANLLVGLLNKHIYKRQYYGALGEAKKFEKLPKDYIKLMKILYENKDLGKTTRAAIELYDNCLEFLKGF